MNLDRLTDELWRLLQEDKPRALLLGEAPEGIQKYNYVNKEPYEAIVIGNLSPGQLLQMPSEPVCLALLQGIPVYLSHQIWPPGNSAPELRQDLHKALQRLRRYGAVSLHEEKCLITAQRARVMAAAGKWPADGCRLTPLARDILEGREQ